ncbi:hypothetical protein, partial [Pasteurella multocida]
QSSQAKLDLDRELNTARISADIQKESGRQAVDMEKFKTEVQLKQTPVPETEVRNNIGLD